MSSSTDADLMARVRSGDRAAFSTLIDRHKDAMVNYLTRLTGCRERAEDVAQETFIRLYRTASRYQEQGRLSGYVYRIATNLVRQDERKQRRWRLLSASISPGSSFPGGTGPGPSPQEELLRTETQRQVAAAVAALPLRFRIPLVLHDIQGWPYEDIARLAGCPTGTIKSRLNRARQRLRQRLMPYWHGRESHEGQPAA